MTTLFNTRREVRNAVLAGIVGGVLTTVAALALHSCSVCVVVERPVTGLQRECASIRAYMETHR